MDSKVTVKDWINFTIFVIVILAAGAMIGFSVGRNHPNSSVKEKWMSELEAEVNNLMECQRMVDEEYRVNTAIRDSIICTLKREVEKGVNADVPIIVSVSIKE